MIRHALFGLAALAALGLTEAPADAGCATYTRSSSSYSNSHSGTYKVQGHGFKAYVDHGHEAYFFPKFLLAAPYALLPSYSAQYVPQPNAPVPGQPTPPVQPADPARQQQSAGELQQVLKGLTDVTATLRDFDSRLRILEARQGVQPAPQPQPQALPKQPAPAPKQGAQAAPKQHTFASINAAFCAACHEKGNEGNGGEFVLSANNKMVKLTDAQVGKMSKVLLRGSMPKLNDHATKSGITRLLDQAEAQAILEEVDRQVGGAN